MFSIISGFYLLKASLASTPSCNTRSVFWHCQMTPTGPNHSSLKPLLQNTIIDPLLQMKKLRHSHAAAAAKSPQSCPTLCDPIDGSPPGSAIPGILQARTLEWVAISFSNAEMWKSESEVSQSCLTLSDPMDCSPPGSSVHGFSRQEYWSGVPSPYPRHSHRST